MEVEHHGARVGRRTDDFDTTLAGAWGFTFRWGWAGLIFSAAAPPVFAYVLKRRMKVEGAGVS